MDIGTRYQDIATSFNSIRDDAKKMVDQIADGKLDVFERVTNAWMKISRGDIADRFDAIKEKYLEVSRSTNDQIKREAIILEAYRDFRGALKQAEVLALEVLKTAEARLADSEGEARRGGRGRGRFRRNRGRRSRPARTRARRRASPHAGRGQALPDRQGSLRQPDGQLQHVGSRDGAADADDERQGARLCAVRVVLLDQRQRADRAEGVLHRHVRPARVHADAGSDEGRHVQEPRDARRHGRQDPGSRRARRLRPDHPRRQRQEACRQRRRLPGAVAADRRGDAQDVDAELGRDPRRGRGRQAPRGEADHGRQGARRSMADAASTMAARRRRRAAPEARRPHARHGRRRHAAP